VNGWSTELEVKCNEKPHESEDKIGYHCEIVSWWIKSQLVTKNFVSWKRSVEKSPIPDVIPIKAEQCSNHLGCKVQPEQMTIFIIKVFWGTNYSCDCWSKFACIFQCVYQLSSVVLVVPLMQALPKSPPER